MGANHHFTCKKCKLYGGHFDRFWADIPEWNQFLIKHIYNCGEENIGIFSSYCWEEVEDYDYDNSTRFGIDWGDTESLGDYQHFPLNKDIESYTTKELTEKAKNLATKLYLEYEEIIVK